MGLLNPTTDQQIAGLYAWLAGQLTSENPPEAILITDGHLAAIDAALTELFALRGENEKLRAKLARKGKAGAKPKPESQLSQTPGAIAARERRAK